MPYVWSEVNAANYVVLFKEKYGSALSETEVKAIYKAMCKVYAHYQETGFCYERSVALREILNKGSVATFSFNGLSVKFESDKVYKETASIAIPYDFSYNDQTEWIYHSVFEYKNFIFAFEISRPVYIKEYRTALDSETFKLYSRKYNITLSPKKCKYLIPMRYEKQLST